ncbi:IS5 family transposase [Bacteroidia bacterium]|nr:IS5 family transposase [Bacteroidia bacterium]
MYQVLDKDTINSEILPHLSVAKRGFKTKSSLSETVNCILYKLKTGCQWHLLPVKSLFSEVVLSYQAVFWHFRKWCKNGDWKQSWISLLKKHKSELDLSSADIDGSHTTALRGGEEVAYQGRKSRKTTNSLFLTDRQGLPLALSSPIAGNHHDLYQIERALKDMFDTVSSAGIAIDGLFINADSGFDSKEFRLTCFREGIHANVDFNRRNSNGNEDDDYLLDEMLYKERYSIERTNAWMDSFRSILNRFDVTVTSWESFNYIAFIVILLKKIKQKKKSK